jgi:D-alanyl-D-alanine dipeptidase
MTLVAIAPPDYEVAIDLRYATPANFTGKPVYARAEAFLHVDAARHLARAIELAAALGLHFKIFDAFRPSEAQWKLWDFRPDPDFLADPRRGSPHSRGVAVDLTLVEERYQPPDHPMRLQFPEGRYLKFLVLQSREL